MEPFTYRSVDRDILRTMEPAGRGYYALLAVCLLLILWGAYAWRYQVQTGLAVAGINNPVGWGAHITNFVFWVGIAQAGLVFASIQEMTGARWSPPIRRIAEGTAAFLPVSFLLFLVLFAGRETVFPWIRNPIPQKQAWLDAPFLFTRDAVALLLGGLSIVFLYFSLRPEAEFARAHGGRWASPLYNILLVRRRGRGVEPGRSRVALGILAPVLGIAYCLSLTLIAFDLVMSLDPGWSSTLFGAYFFVGNLYVGLACLVVLAASARRALGLEAVITRAQFHDLGKLLFAFCMLTVVLVPDLPDRFRLRRVGVDRGRDLPQTEAVGDGQRLARHLRWDDAVARIPIRIVHVE